MAKTAVATETQMRELREAREQWEEAKAANWDNAPNASALMSAAAQRLNDAEYDIFGFDTPTF